MYLNAIYTAPVIQDEINDITAKILQQRMVKEIEIGEDSFLFLMMKHRMCQLLNNSVYVLNINGGVILQEFVSFQDLHQRFC